jgi:hypothetical protein
MDWRNLLRNTRHCVRVAPSLAVIAGLLGGCIGSIAPPIPIVVSGTGKAYSPALALAGYGTNHIVWQECRLSGGCVDRLGVPGRALAPLARI